MREKIVAEVGDKIRTEKRIADIWKTRADLALRKGDKATFRERYKNAVKAWESALAHDPANVQLKTEFHGFLNEGIKKAEKSGDTELVAELRQHL